MQKKLLLTMIAGILFTSIFGTLAHFTYEWSNKNFLVGLFTPVSESTWEHMKLLFFPMFLYGIFICTRLGQDYPCLSCAYPLGILAGTFAIPALFYTYSGILGRTYTPIDILIFYISVILAFAIVYRITLRCQERNPYERKSCFFLWLLVLLLAIGFMVFTVSPPSLGIFEAGIANEYNQSLSTPPSRSMPS